MTTLTNKKWMDELAVELRMKGVSGARIGDTLASVNEFVSDSGEDPEDAFGTPREYAANLALPAGDDSRDIARLSAVAGIGFLAFIGFSQAVWPLAANEPVPVAAAQLAWYALPFAIIVCLPLYLSLVIRRMWMLVILAVICMAAGVLAALSAPRSAADAWLAVDPVPVLIVTGAIMVAASLTTAVASWRDADPILDPLGDPVDATSATPSRSALERIGGIVGMWLFPILSVIYLGAALAAS